MRQGVPPALLRDVVNVGLEETDSLNALSVWMDGSKMSMDHASNAIQSVSLVNSPLNIATNVSLLIFSSQMKA